VSKICIAYIVRDKTCRWLTLFYSAGSVPACSVTWQATINTAM